MRERLLSLFLSFGFLDTRCHQAAVNNQAAGAQEQGSARQQVEHLRACQSQAVFLQLFSAGARAGLGAPWLTSFPIPLGAILFLLHARKRRREAPSGAA